MSNISSKHTNINALSTYLLKLIEILFLLASPKVILPDPATVVGALPGFKLSCTAIPEYYSNHSIEDIPGHHLPQLPVYLPKDLPEYVPGSYPMHIAIVRNSSLLVNETGTASIRLYKEGNYSCVATNIYGIAIKKFAVVFTGKTLLCSDVPFSVMIRESASSNLSQYVLNGTAQTNQKKKIRTIIIRFEWDSF